jgi:hypothetical protein
MAVAGRRGAWRTVRISLLLGALVLFPATAVFAQTQPELTVPAPPPAAGTEQTAVTGADTGASNVQLKTEAATRAQIRAIRMALKIRLAALHH